MRLNKFLFFFIFYSLIFSADISIEISPDSIYVGEIISIQVNINNLKNDEVPYFTKINDDNTYSLLNYILNNNSATYEIQIWDTDVTIPSITVDIKQKNVLINTLKSDEIIISILTNIDSQNADFKPIKPMQETFLQHPYSKLFYYLITSVSLLFILFCWKYRKETISIKKYKVKQNIFIKTKEAIDDLQIPNNLNLSNVEKYYVNLSLICRKYIKNKLYIRATEMTSHQLNDYFKSNNYDRNIIIQWNKINYLSDMAKYAAKIPNKNELKNNKSDFMNLILLFEKKH